MNVNQWAAALATYVVRRVRALPPKKRAEALRTILNRVSMGMAGRVSSLTLRKMHDGFSADRALYAALVEEYIALYHRRAGHGLAGVPAALGDFVVEGLYGGGMGTVDVAGIITSATSAATGLATTIAGAVTTSRQAEYERQAARRAEEARMAQSEWERSQALRRQREAERQAAFEREQARRRAESGLPAEEPGLPPLLEPSGGGLSTNTILLGLGALVVVGGGIAAAVALSKK